MSPWWSQAWIEHWGPALFHGMFWALTGVGMWAARAAGRGWLARHGVAVLWSGIMLGLVLIAAGLVALGVGQPGYVWARLGLFGSVFVVVHTALLVASVYTRRGIAPVQTGDKP